MATNRLYLYDPETNTACMIARGYSCSWGHAEKHISDFFDGFEEFTGELEGGHTRLQLKTEGDLPKCDKEFYSNSTMVRDKFGNIRWIDACQEK